MTQQKKIGIAIIGTGHIGPRHAKSVFKSHGAELLCFVDPAPQAQSVSNEFQRPVFKSIGAMVTSGIVPDAAIVSTPNSTHVVVAQEALSAGMHVLVEKPISTTVPSGQDLLKTTRDSGKKLLVGHHRRFNPYITSAKQALESNTIGRPIAVSGIWATHKPASYFQSPTEWRQKGGDGGPILINLIHEIDCLQYLLGPIIRVHAEQTISQRGYEAEEGAAILLRFASGVVGTFLLSDATPSPHFFEAATGENPIVPKVGKDIYRVFGTEGTLSVGDMRVVKYADGDEKSWTSTLTETTLHMGEEVPFDEQIEHLVRVVRGEEEPRCTGEDGLSALVVCDAIKRAMATGSAVDIGVKPQSE